LAGKLSAASLKHDCLERDSHGIGAELTNCFGERLDDPLRIDASACSNLFNQWIAELISGCVMSGHTKQSSCCQLEVTALRT
jgi:hypothetical protein